MTTDQELMLHKIEIAEGEVTLDAHILREVITQLRRETPEQVAAIRAAYAEGKEIGYEDGYIAGRHAMAQEAKDLIDEL